MTFFSTIYDGSNVIFTTAYDIMIITDTSDAIGYVFKIRNSYEM